MIAGLLARRARRTPDRVALVTPDGRYSYAALHERARRAAGALAAAGIGPGDRVSALLGNRVEYVDVMAACATLGAICVPLNWRLAAPEIEFMIADAGARGVVYDAEFAETVKAVRPAVGVHAWLAVGEGTDDASYEAAIRAAEPMPERAEPSDADVLAIFYTSGTTGRPKGAMLTYGNFRATNLDMLLALDLAHDERTLVVLPMFHVGGWNVNTIAVWWKGGTVYLERAFDPERVLRLVAQERLTSIMGVPTIYQMLADDPGFAGADLSSLRTLVCGGAPLPESLIHRYLDRGLQLVQGYGLTEASPNVLMLPPEEALPKLGAAGRPYFGVEVRVVDAEDRDVRRPGEGEIVVRGPNVMKGYWMRPEATDEALRGGWLRTGDVGRIDADGTIWIVDRTKDMFISGGENVYPAEIEKALASHPKVLEAAVIGVADERWGEAGRAIVVAREPVEPSELIAYLRERLAKYKVPREVVFADAIPRTSTGKIVKHELKERYA